MAGRKKNEAKTPSFEVTPEQTPGIERAQAAANELARMSAEAAENAQALAEHFGYEGALTVGAVEDEIRHYQRRTAEACFELGKRLLILKELTPHGEFQQRLELLGIEVRSAQRFMAVSSKFSNAVTSPLLKTIGTQSKLLELLVLDDSEIEALEAGETVRGLDLDKIDTMSVRELKAALREAHANSEATGRVLEGNQKTINTLQKDLEKTRRRIEKEEPDETAEALRKVVTQEAFGVSAAIAGSLRPAIEALLDHSHAHDLIHDDFIVGQICQLESELSVLRGRFALKDKPDGDHLPDWAKPDADAVQAKKLDEIKKRVAKGNGESHA